jgi:hypothetical protein
MAFDPDSVTGLVEHWDPDSISGSQGDDITEWTGEVNSLVLAGPATDEPTLMVAARQPSTHQMLLMNTASARMTVADASLENGTMTAFVVFLPIAHKGSTGIQWVFNKDNTNPATIALQATSGASGAYRSGVRLDGAEGTFESVDATGYNQRAAPQVLTLRYDGTDLILRANGVEIATLEAVGAIDNDSPGNLVLGNHPSSFTVCNAMFGDVVWYDNAVSDVNMAAIEDWLIEKWLIDDYEDDYTTGSVTVEATPAAGEEEIFSPCIRELDEDTWIMFGAIKEAAGDWKWIDYWTAPKSDPHNWTRNTGGPIIEAVTDSPPECRGVAAVYDGSTVHILVDGADGSLYHFTGTDLASLTDNGAVFNGVAETWEAAIRHPDIAETKVGDAWAVYYDARAGSPTSGNGSIGRTLTEDFSTFTDRTEVFTASDLWWMVTDVGAPSSKFRNDQWELAFAGFNDNAKINDSNHYIGVAKSANGTSFELATEFPILVPQRTVSNFSVDNPELFDDGSNLYLYFVARSANVDADIAAVQLGDAYDTALAAAAATDNVAQRMLALGLLG